MRRDKATQKVTVSSAPRNQIAPKRPKLKNLTSEHRSINITTPYAHHGDGNTQYHHYGTAADGVWPWLFLVENEQ